jgi:aqualysin 1
MHRLNYAALTLATVALAACSVDAPSVAAPEPTPALSATGAPSTSVGAANSVPGQYIVVLRAGAPGGRQNAERKAAGGAVIHTYSHVLNGFAAKLGPLAVAALRSDPDVLLVEPDPVISVDVTQSSAPWGLDRIDQAALPLSTTYSYSSTGTGVTVYIVDTGMRLTHVEFGGRAVAGYDAITPGGSAADCHGHGTHVGGTVGGGTYGVAKSVRLVAVRVLDCTGNGTGSQILAGLDWIVSQKQASPATPMVVNMSLGGSASASIDNAVSEVIASGVTAVVAAGNAAGNACNVSPARVAPAITVGATDSGDRFANFSNRGSCVDLSGPGVSIRSSAYASNTATAVMSGTSMATPHVAGVAALYLQQNPSATPAQVAAALNGGALTGKIVALPASTPDRLLNVAFLSPSTPTSGQLVSATGTGCLMINSTDVTKVIYVVVAPCQPGSNRQTWSAPATGTPGAITLVAGGTCLGGWSTGKEGAVVGTNACNPSAVTQQWTLTPSGELRLGTGYCATAVPVSWGTKVITSACTGSAAQRWSR